MFDLIRANQRRTIVLVVAMGALLVTLGAALGELYLGYGSVGLLFALALWFFLTLISYFQGDRIVLAVSRARRIGKEDHPTLYNVVEEMTIASGLGTLPAIYIIDDPSPNAFAAGRNPEHAVVAVTSGLLMMLSRDELQGVIAHELGHIRNRDVLYMTMLAVMLGSIILIADVGRRHLFWGGPSRTRRSSRDGGGAHALLIVVAVVLILIAPLIGQLLYLAVSRRREYLADASGASYTRLPEALASALEKIGSAGQKLSVANPATAAMYFVNPLTRPAESLERLSSTHPPIAERVRILRSMGSSFNLASYDHAFRVVTGRPVGMPASLTKEEPVPTPREQRTAPVGALWTGAAAQIGRVRETTDALWRTDGYRFIECPCGTRLKIPPQLAARAIDCPHCGQTHG